ncbi:hypothetical protein M5K25_007528 [Dendrobium thyrsiflorum]|uniref:Small nuclear ribonucleoprotein Sm D3 n=1 Tax=Dendrobium thyrsiflorum TaxID=117978 RepID=A0ABD0VEU7_DENTH
MSRSLGIPVKLLHEAAGHVVTVELKSGELYRGSMIECEDNWNCQLENITYTAKFSTVNCCEITSAAKILWITLCILQNLLARMVKCHNLSMFSSEEVKSVRGSHTDYLDFVKGKGSSLGVGRGRAVAMRARGIDLPLGPAVWLLGSLLSRAFAVDFLGACVWAAVPRVADGELSSLEAFVYPVPASVLVSEQIL